MIFIPTNNIVANITPNISIPLVSLHLYIKDISIIPKGEVPEMLQMHSSANYGSDTPLLL